MVSAHTVQGALDYAMTGADDYAGQDTQGDLSDWHGTPYDFHHAPPDPPEELGSYGNGNLTT